MPCWHRTPQSCQPCPPISPKLTWSVWVLRASPQTQQDRPSAPRASPTARRAQGHPKKVRDAESWCWNPPSSPVLQDFCASSFGKVWELPRSNGARAICAARGAGTQPAPSVPVVPSTKPVQRQAQKEGRALGSISILPRTWLFSPPRGTVLLQPVGCYQGTGTKPHKGNTAPAETGSPFYSSAQRSRAPGLDSILGDEQPHPSHPETKTQQIFWMPGCAEGTVRVQQDRF